MKGAYSSRHHLAPTSWFSMPFHCTCSYKAITSKFRQHPLNMQAVGAPVGAYLVQHLDPQRLQFAIATALLFLFLLMATPVSQWVRRARLQRARSLRRGGSAPQRGAGSNRRKSALRQPLLPSTSGGPKHGTLRGRRLTLTENLTDRRNCEAHIRHADVGTGAGQRRLKVCMQPNV